MNDKFFPELARRLKREGISTGPVEMERLPVLLDGQKVMAVAPGGTIFLMPETADTQPVVDAYDTVAGISAQVHEYTEAMAAAPPLAAEGLHEGFRLLAEFNGVVLAGQELEGTWGYKFVTWARSPDRTAVAHGHYYDGGDSYEAAKLDFACRAGLVQESRLYGAPAKASFSFRAAHRGVPLHRGNLGQRLPHHQGTGENADNHHGADFRQRGQFGRARQPVQPAGAGGDGAARAGDAGGHSQPGRYAL